MAPATTASAPANRARDDLDSTYVDLVCRFSYTANPEPRWTYLEKSVNNVMTKLQEGLDMKTYM